MQRGTREEGEALGSWQRSWLRSHVPGAAMSTHKNWASRGRDSPLLMWGLTPKILLHESVWRDPSSI